MNTLEKSEVIGIGVLTAILFLQVYCVLSSPKPSTMLFTLMNVLSLLAAIRWCDIRVKIIDMVLYVVITFSIWVLGVLLSFKQLQI
jgi:hypothetical protein